jgi:hypothetical protein
MYYAEKNIDGILHFRNTPNEKWVAMTQEQLTAKLIDARNTLQKVQGIFDAYLQKQSEEIPA